MSTATSKCVFNFSGWWEYFAHLTIDNLIKDQDYDLLGAGQAISAANILKQIAASLDHFLITVQICPSQCIIVSPPLLFLFKERESMASCWAIFFFTLSAQALSMFLAAWVLAEATSILTLSSSLSFTTFTFSTCPDCSLFQSHHFTTKHSQTKPCSSQPRFSFFKLRYCANPGTLWHNLFAENENIL